MANNLSDQARREAEVHKWLLSEEAKRDMGAEAIEDWFRVHFHGFARKCLFDHITGRCCYDLFNPDAFNIVQVHQFREPNVGQKVIELLLSKQNLDIFRWICDAQITDEEVLDDVIDFLSIVNVNICHDLGEHVKPKVLAACCPQ